MRQIARRGDFHPSRMKESTSQALRRVLRGVISQALIERRASRIDDPIKRLRYLRSAGNPPPPVRARPHLVFWAVAPVVLVMLGLSLVPLSRTASPPKRIPVAHAAGPPFAVSAVPAKVWLVEENRDAELYSNGLRVERRYLTESEPRGYRVFRRCGAPTDPPDHLNAPAGIVFHASESDLAPFEPDHAETVKRQALGLLGWVQSKKLYHYVVDRIGRVYRVLKDEDRADHAGNSVWADSDWIYLNLNDTFLGVAFEARTGRELEPAQVHAGRILVDMLRSRHGMAPGNCVTHAQVSVNPGNFRVGYHTDWIANFPFRDLGLTDNYGRRLASVDLFGFLYDPSYLDSAAAPLRQSLLHSKEQLRREAEEKGFSLELHERNLRTRYRQFRAAIMRPNQESSYAN